VGGWLLAGDPNHNWGEAGQLGPLLQLLLPGYHLLFPHAQLVGDLLLAGREQRGAS